MRCDEHNFLSVWNGLGPLVLCCLEWNVSIGSGIVFGTIVVLFVLIKLLINLLCFTTCL